MESDLRRRDSFLLNKPMKLYLVSISPACRIVWLYCLHNNLPVELIDIDVFGGEQDTADFRKLNPSGETPVLVNGDIIVYEAVPILLYLAEKYAKFALFGASSKETAMVKSLLGWVSTKLHTTVGFRVVYPNFIEAYQPGEEATEALIDKGTLELTKELEFMENCLLGNSQYIAGGDDPSIADYFAATVLCQLDWVSFEFTLWHKLSCWLERVKNSRDWDFVHEKHYGFVAKLQSSHDLSLSSSSSST